MSPTIFIYGPYRFYVNSREEKRRHIHIHSSDGEAKYWLEPGVVLAVNYGLPEHDLTKIREIVLEKRDEFIDIWDQHFSVN